MVVVVAIRECVRWTGYDVRRIQGVLRSRAQLKRPSDCLAPKRKENCQPFCVEGGKQLDTELA